MTWKFHTQEVRKIGTQALPGMVRDADPVSVWPAVPIGWFRGANDLPDPKPTSSHLLPVSGSRKIFWIYSSYPISLLLGSLD